MSDNFNKAPLWRRLAAIGYDSLLLLGIWFVGTTALLPLTGGHAIASGNGFYMAYLLALGFLLFGWCWRHGGQTLGMRAWRIKLVRRAGGVITWGCVVRRFFAALVSWAALGLGFWWQWFDREQLAWHDRCSDTMLVLIKP